MNDKTIEQTASDNALKMNCNNRTVFIGDNLPIMRGLNSGIARQLAVAKMKNIDWKDAQAIGDLRIADFACGTRALLSAVYDQIANRYERNGGNPAKLHQSMMEKVLMGFDVLPYAAHLTASILSGKEPAIIYDRSCIYTMPFGRQKDRKVKIGSLEFLAASEQLVLQAVRENTGPAAKRLRGHQESDLHAV